MDTWKGGRDRIYRADRWSRYQWRRFMEESGGSEALLKNGANRLSGFEAFGRELFARLHGSTSPLDEVRPEDAWAQKAHDELGALPEFDRLRRRCRGDRLAAGTAAIDLLERMLVELPPPTNTEDVDALRDQVRGLLDFARATSGAPRASIEDELEALRSRGRSAVSEAKAYADALHPSVVRRTLRDAITSANGDIDTIDATTGVFCAWGTGSGSCARRTSRAAKAELSRRVSTSERLRRLVEMAGRLKHIAAVKQRCKVDRAASELTAIGRGADIGRVLPSELVLLAHPASALEFARRFTERGLFQYELTDTEVLARGPIVVCLDQSSSMEGPKEVWSKALALAMLEVAAQQNRSCRVVHFNGAVVRVDDWPAGRADPVALLESMETFAGGGTNFVAPLRCALDAINHDPTLHQADVVLVTDGEAAVEPAFLDEWARVRTSHGFACFAVHVDAPAGVVPRVLHELADEVIGLADVTNDAAATDALFNI